MCFLERMKEEREYLEESEGNLQRSRKKGLGVLGINKKKHSFSFELGLMGTERS